MVTLITGLQIQENETLVCPYMDKASGKYGYAITLTEERNYRTLISCQAIYDSNDVALAAGNKLRDDINELDLSPKKRSLVDAVGGPETARTIDTIVQASKVL
jgi:hypothetical protein